MIIDFHTHIFPEKIVDRTLESLTSQGNVKAYSRPCADGLICEMEKAGIDISVSLPVVTNPAQFDSINRFAADVNSKFASGKRRIISFGGIHPDCDDIEGKMRYIKELGLLGVKIHPDYQGRYINDERYVKILECARDNDLIVLTHTGYDFLYSDRPMKCPPELIIELLRRVPYTKLVLAHLGANCFVDKAYEMLAGEDVYLDTGFVIADVDGELFKRLVAKHGEDRILFATDSPWADASVCVDRLKSFSLPREIEEKILWKNAKELLGI
jgi:predicted TIM-barrel fold metal-dependent hydrolase